MSQADIKLLRLLAKRLERLSVDSLLHEPDECAPRRGLLEKISGVERGLGFIDDVQVAEMLSCACKQRIRIHVHVGVRQASEYGPHDVR